MQFSIALHALMSYKNLLYIPGARNTRYNPKSSSFSEFLSKVKSVFLKSSEESIQKKEKRRKPGPEQSANCEWHLLYMFNTFMSAGL